MPDGKPPSALSEAMKSYRKTKRKNAPKPVIQDKPPEKVTQREKQRPNEYRLPYTDANSTEFERMLARVHRRLAPIARANALPGKQAQVMFRVGEAREICTAIYGFIEP